MVALSQAGFRVTHAVRRPASAPNEIEWSPARGELEPGRSFHAVVHLAGEGLASTRWNDAAKRRMRSSRVEATQALCERLSAGRSPPRVLVSASAVGIYGDRGDEVLDESSPSGSGFLAELAWAWERACDPLASVGCRVVNLRLGLVLTSDGGALAPLLRATRWGLGGPLASGRQFWSWVALADVLAVFRRALDRPSLAGPVNVTAPHPVRQREFARVLARVMRRPAVWPAPAPLLRLILGEMADDMLLSSARALPHRLEADGFTFLHPELEGALRAVVRGAG